MCCKGTFNQKLIEILINAGYVILSQKLYVSKKYYTSYEKYKRSRTYLSSYFMCALIYYEYPILFLSKLKEPKISLIKYNKYELKINTEFENIIDNCIKYHGKEWLTEPLKNVLIKIFNENKNIQMICFGLYRDNEIKAGEFGIIIGKMYISYTSYHEENSSGTIQMIKTFRYLKNIGIICCNLFGLGKGNDYKYKFGTINLLRDEYIKLFRELCNDI